VLGADIGGVAFRTHQLHYWITDVVVHILAVFVLSETSVTFWFSICFTFCPNVRSKFFMSLIWVFWVLILETAWVSPLIRLAILFLLSLSFCLHCLNKLKNTWGDWLFHLIDLQSFARRSLPFSWASCYPWGARRHLLYCTISHNFEYFSLVFNFCVAFSGFCTGSYEIQAV
jgi:hypothetical protein